MFPTTIASFFPGVEAMEKVKEFMAPGSPGYVIVFVGFIIFFCFFYTAITFNPTEVAENMKKNGGYIPGIRPGKRTADHIDSVLTRLTLVGAIYVSAVCVLPSGCMGMLLSEMAARILISSLSFPDNCRLRFELTTTS